MLSGLRFTSSITISLFSLRVQFSIDNLLFVSEEILLVETIFRDCTETNKPFCNRFVSKKDLNTKNLFVQVLFGLRNLPRVVGAEVRDEKNRLCLPVKRNADSELSTQPTF